MTKPKLGDCGTCHWFERPEQWTAPPPVQGLCLVNPPTPLLGLQEVQGSRLSPGGPQVTHAVQGMVPPTTADRRCEKWRPTGMLPEMALRGRVN